MISLRWSLARILHVSGGHASHGLISWDMYVDWSEAEIAKPTSSQVMPLNTERPLLSLDYPTTHFEALSAPLQQPLPSIISNVPSLLARLTATLSSYTLLFSICSYLVLILLHCPPNISTLNTSVPRMQ